MTILSALFAGVSGLDSYANALSVLSNNIANVNTTGFKSSRAEFADILSQSLSGASGSSQIGRGVFLSEVTNVFTQGSFETTSSATDLAIDGDGFFIVNKGTGNYYARAGRFILDKDGKLANPEGFFLRGYALDPTTGIISSALQDINIGSASASPQATTEVNIASNLDSTSTVKNTAGYATSSAAVTDGFIFTSGFTITTGTNDVIRWDDGDGATRAASITTAGGLTSAQISTGAEVAAAIKAALEATNDGAQAADTYTVSYSPTTGKFTIANDAGNVGTIVLHWEDAATTAESALAFNSVSSGNIAPGSSDVSDSVVNDANALIIFNDGSDRRANLLVNGGLTANTVYTGDQVATAIKTAIEATNGGGDLYTVSYDENTQKFTITNNNGNTNPITLKWSNNGSGARTTLGFNASDTALAVNSSDTSDNTVAFNVISGVNDQFALTVDGTSSAADITIAAGTYTTTSLATEMQNKIRADAAFSGKTIEVNYGVTVPKRFTIKSDTTGTSSTLTVTPDATQDFLQSINMGSGGTSTAILYQGNTIDRFNPITSSNFSTSITGYDSLGNPHTLSVYFRKDSNNTWSWSALVDGGDITGGTTGINEEEAKGQLTFTSDGALNTESTTSSIFNFSGGATQGQVIALDFGTSLVTDAGTTGLDGTTQFAGVSSTISQSQDGFSAGQLQSVGIDDDGIITGLFTNGQTQSLAQVALARFASVEGLNAAGGNRFSETQASGQPIVGVPDTGGRGTIASNALELSNVDLASEFVTLIKTQQAFQANARVISTTDSLLTELVNLKR
ncbi:MAG: flagellar hook-basal body complex protein [Candidatus Tectomicrobia bacterium]|uniref:Flagellar hook protein FlgE n=1 Tax=Tectimicrobiota bacterium TaxID=2528274 RepID=A0A932GN43_UNCTE|nr:flagellar hook-basal body complex protein [Candidatus Tectomicrobia bacterium]